MENCVFKKIYLEDNTLVRIHLILVNNSLRLVVLRNEKAWKSYVISEKLNHFAIQHKLSLENYIEKLLEYVKNENAGVAFNATDEDFVVNRLLDNKLKVKYFSCKLEKVNYVEYVEEIMDTFYSDNVKCMEKLNTTIKEKNEIETYKIDCELKLKELIEKKRTDDEELLGRFILILNEKKHRIQHLTELLEAFKAGRPTINPSVHVKSRKKKSNTKELPSTVKKLETISESDQSGTSGTETDTDNSEEERSSVSKKDSEPSTSAQSFDFLKDDVEETPVLPKRVKRDTNSGDNITILPSTSRIEQAADSNKDGGDSKNNKKESPSIEFSTQALLDML